VHSADLEEELVPLLNLRPDSFPPTKTRSIVASLAETCVEVNCDYAQVCGNGLTRSRVISIASKHTDRTKRVFNINTASFDKKKPYLRIISDESHLDLVKRGTTGPDGIKNKIVAEWKCGSRRPDIYSRVRR
jgi:hypothetical protein